MIIKCGEPLPLRACSLRFTSTLPNYHPPALLRHLLSCQVRRQMWKDRIRCQGNGGNAFPEGFRPCFVVFLPEISSRPSLAQYKISLCSASIAHWTLGFHLKHTLGSCFESLKSSWPQSYPIFPCWIYWILCLPLVWPHEEGTSLVLFSTGFPSTPDTVLTQTHIW